MPNTLMPSLGVGGAVCVVANQAVDLLVDVAGYLAPGGAGFIGVNPFRALDTRGGGARGRRREHVGRPPHRGPRRARRSAGRGRQRHRHRGARHRVRDGVAVRAAQADGVDREHHRRRRPGRQRHRAGVAQRRPVPVAERADAPDRGRQRRVRARAAGLVQSVVPVRRLDTRVGQGGYGRPGAGQSITLPIAGRNGIPATAQAVRANITAAGPAGATFVTAYPCNRWVPTISNLNTEPASPARGQRSARPARAPGARCASAPPSPPPTCCSTSPATCRDAGPAALARH